MKRLLTILGAASMFGLLAMVVSIGLIGSKAMISADQNKQAAVNAVRKISQNWSVDGHDEIVAASLARAAQSQNGIRAFRTFGRLGALQHAAKISQTHFGISTENGTTAKVEFNGQFANGSARMIVVLRKIDGTMKVVGLHTEKTELRKRAPLTSA